MKLKGKAILSLLLVFTLMTQLFTFSAAATGGESLVYALYLQDEYGQVSPVADEAAIDYQNYTVSVGDWTALSTGPSGVSLSQLLTEPVKVTPPAGFSVVRLWLYGSDSTNPVALPLTAADPSQNVDPRTVSVACDALIGGSDYGTPTFNEQMLSSWSYDGLYTLGVLLKRVESGDVVISDEYGNVRDYNATTTPGHPGDQGDSAFVGWRLRYANGASVLIAPNTYIQPYESCTLSAAYAPIITLQPRSMTVSEGTWISEVESSAYVDVYNLPGDLVLSYANAYVADASDPLSAGSYSLRVGGYQIVDRNTGFELTDSSRAVVRCEDGVVTVEGTVSQWVEPEPIPQDNGWTEPDNGNSEPQYNPPTTTTVNVTVLDQGWIYNGVPDGVGYTCLSLDPWVEGANFDFTYTDAWGNTTNRIENAGEYTLNAVYTGGLDGSLYTVNVLNSAKVTIYPRALTVTADSDSKQYDGSPLVNTDYTTDGLVEGHSLTNVQFSIADAYGNWLNEWPSAEGSYSKMVSGVTVQNANGYDVGANYDIRFQDGTLTVTAPPAPQRTEIVASLGSQSLAYTGAAQQVDPSLVQLEPAVSGALFAISYVDANGQTLSSVTDAGSYTMQLSYTGGLDENAYTVSVGSVGTLTVSKAALTVTASSDSKTYDGSPLVNTDYSAEGLVGGDTVSSVQFSLQDANGNWLDNWPSAAGSYTKAPGSVVVANASGYDVSANYDITTVNGTLIINEAARTAVTASLANQSLAYTGAAQQVDPSLVQLEPAVSGALFAISYVDANGQTLSSVTDAGSYTMQLSYTGGLDENAYTVSVGSVGTLTVSKAALTVTASSDSKTYDGSPLVNTDYSAEGLLPGHSFREGDGVSFQLTDANGSAVESALSVGSYTKTITAVHVVDGAGREVTDNYSLTLNAGNLTIAAAERTVVTVTVPERSFVYDGAPHSFDASILSISPAVEGILLQVSILDNGQTRESVTEVGSYTLQASYAGGLDANLYEVQIANTAALTVTPCELTVTAESDSKTYDGSPLQNTHYTASALLEGHRFRENDPVEFTVKDANGNTVQGWPVQKGEYSKTASAVHILDAEGRDVSGNYQLKPVAGNLIITAPEIVNVTVTVSNQTWVYDGQPHSPKADQYTVEGLKDNDKLNVTLKAAQTNGTELESVTDVGNYIIKANVSGYDAQKYSVTVKAGSLSVTPYAVTVTAASATKNYDGQPLQDTNYSVNPALLSGHRFRDGDGVRFSVMASNGALLSAWPSAQGSYTKRIAAVTIVNASGVDVTRNYQITKIDGTLSINAGVPTPRNFLDDYGNIMQNANGFQYTKKTASGLRFRIDADPQLLSRVLVDNTVVPSQYYSVQTGSTVLTLQQLYLDTLTNQQHVLRVEYSDNGYATTTFTVNEATPSVTSVTFKGANDSKAYDGQAYDLTGAYINRFYSNTSIQSISFHLGQGGMSVSQAVNPGTYDIYLDRLVLNQKTPNQQYNITVKDSNNNTVATNYQNTSVRVGTLTIEQSRSKTQVRVSVTDQTWTYDGTAHQLNPSGYTVEGMPAGARITVKLSVIDKNGRTLTNVTDAGTYSIRADVTDYDSSLYTVTTTGVGTLTVNPFKLTLTAESASKTYDGTVLRNSNVKATALVNGHKFRSGDGVKFSVYDSKGNLIQNGPVNVGTYTKKVTEVHIVDGNNIEVTANYDITRIDGTLTIVSGSGSPKTGDQNRIGLWLGLLAVSAVLVIVVAIILLRRNARPRRKSGGRTQARPADTQTRRVDARPRDRK